MQSQPDPQTISFSSQTEWEEWLAENYGDQRGIWMRIFKKQSDIPSVTYAEALDTALCYGWIDGQKKAFDETSWLQRFVPRRRRSQWSKINRQHVARLKDACRMKPSGLKEVEEAQRDGRWDAAYDSPSAATVPPDLQEALDANSAAKAFFTTLDKRNTYAVLYRVTTAKNPETRADRIRTLVEMLARRERLH
jgi:uncharacterized protein YdeI (YjbR/CyaY-like superfamily)